MTKDPSLIEKIDNQSESVVSKFKQPFELKGIISYHNAWTQRM